MPTDAEVPGILVSTIEALLDVKLTDVRIDRYDQAITLTTTVRGKKYQATSRVDARAVEIVDLIVDQVRRDAMIEQYKTGEEINGALAAERIERIQSLNETIRYKELSIEALRETLKAQEELVARFAEKWEPEIQKRLIEPLRGKNAGHHTWVRFPGLKVMHDDLVELARKSEPRGCAAGEHVWIYDSPTKAHCLCGATVESRPGALHIYGGTFSTCWPDFVKMPLTVPIEAGAPEDT